MSLFSKFFRDRPPPPKTVDDHLHDIEEGLVKELTKIGESGSSEARSKEEIHTHLLSLGKIDEIRERRKSRKNKSFFHSPAGASVITAIVTIAATQIPAMTQMFVEEQSAHRAEQTKLRTPVVELVAKDDKLNLGEKLAVIDYVSSRDYQYETVEEYLDRYRSRIRSRANDRIRLIEPKSQDSSNEHVNPNNQLNRDTSR